MKNIILIPTLALLAPFAHAETPAATASDLATPATFDSVDSNQDGAISREEAQPFAAVELIFDSADMNKDGSLDQTEYSKGQAEQKTP